jgi:2-C-methyl-D-erythritol 4-phosphate cytidylyltransferase
MKMTAIVPAAGKGLRLGKSIAKPFVLISGRPLLSITLGALEKSPLIGDIVLAVSGELLDNVKKNIVKKYKISKVSFCIEGGSTRQESVYKALLAIKDTGYKLILIHDGARPFLSEDIIERSYRGVLEFGACVVGVPVKDTIKEARSGKATRTLDRKFLWHIQTPQVFKREIIFNAYKRFYNKGVFSDDASLVEKSKGKVKIIQGSYYNIKITTPEDVALAEKIYEIINDK